MSENPFEPRPYDPPVPLPRRADGLRVWIGLGLYAVALPLTLLCCLFAAQLVDALLRRSPEMPLGVFLEPAILLLVCLALASFCAIVGYRLRRQSAMANDADSSRR